jgi:hypothetical protein
MHQSQRESHWLKNVRSALEMMRDVPPEQVDLGEWSDTNETAIGAPVTWGDQLTCGGVACMGGWCALWPGFQSQGVYPLPGSGEPWVEAGNLTGSSVAQFLFGDDAIFECAWSKERHDHGDDYSIAMARLMAREQVLMSLLAAEAAGSAPIEDSSIVHAARPARDVERIGQVTRIACGVV